MSETENYPEDWMRELDRKVDMWRLNCGVEAVQIEVYMVARGFAAVSDTLREFGQRLRRLYWLMVAENMEYEAERYATRSLPPGDAE